MPLTWYALMSVLALRPEYRPEACAREFSSEANRAACESKQEEGHAWATEVAGWWGEEALRWGFLAPFDMVWLVADAAQESGLQRGEICLRSLRHDRVVSRTELEPARGDVPARYEMCWTYAGDRRNCQRVYLVAEDEERVYLDTCAAGEVGIYQLMSNQIPGRSETDQNGDGEITRADGGYRLPWGGALSTVLSVRRAEARDWRVGIHLGLRTLASERTRCCADPEAGPDCAASWSWLGAHKMGQCWSDGGEAYVERVRAKTEQVLAYLCEQAPWDPLCEVQADPP